MSYNFIIDGSNSTTTQGVSVFRVLYSRIKKNGTLIG